MKIKKWSWRNICSYGNRLQTIEISENPQLILVYGQNGAGKSSIAEALTVSIYGRSLRKKMANIPNRLNRNAYTSTVFQTNNGDEIELERGIDPNFSNLKINGNQYNLPDKRRVDEFIEDQVVRIPLSVFANTINLSINDFKSFIQLNPSDKRKIIDKIFGLDEINSMNQIVKEESKVIKGEIATLENVISKNKHHLQRSKQQLDELNESVNLERENEIKALTVDLEGYSKQKALIRERAEEIAEKIKVIRDDIESDRNIYHEISAKMLSLDEKIKLYELGKCPHCESDLTDHNHSEALTQARIEYDNLKTEKDSLSIQISKKNHDESELAKILSSYKSKYSELNANIAFTQSKIDQLRNQENRKETKSIEDFISNLSEEIRSTEEELFNKKSALQVNLDLEQALSEFGIKKIIMGNIVPTLNQKILKISKALEFKFAFEFDEDFNPIIKHIGHEISPDSLSTGESKKMNLVILLSIIEIIMMKQNGSNILFLDEIFASLDGEVVYKVVETLKTFAKKYRMTIFVVSHEWLPEEFFDTILSVKNVDNFSEIEIKKT